MEIVSCDWVFTIKYLTYGSVLFFKARLVAKGYTQIYGVDYFETLSPLAPFNSAQILISVAGNSGWPFHQLHIKNTSLYGDLTEEYTCSNLLELSLRGRKNKVCRLRKEIYGLKQSPHAWFDKYSSAIQSYGFCRSSGDHSVFVMHRNSGSVILIVYADDILLTSKDKSRITDTKKI